MMIFYELFFIKKFIISFYEFMLVNKIELIMKYGLIILFFFKFMNIILLLLYIMIIPIWYIDTEIFYSSHLWTKFKTLTNTRGWHGSLLGHFAFSDFINISKVIDSCFLMNTDWLLLCIIRKTFNMMIGKSSQEKLQCIHPLN